MGLRSSSYGRFCLAPSGLRCGRRDQRIPDRPCATGKRGQGITGDARLMCR
ncbi:hypothetical protein [Alloactinosynnema sp. L-07]|nr:hypothetical protein [Alloactinosynnema sp. L-07]